jgi:hypothetical protein
MKRCEKRRNITIGVKLSPKVCTWCKNQSSLLKKILSYPLGTGLVSLEKKEHERHSIVLYKHTTKYTRSFLEVFMKIENVRTQSRAKQCTHFAKGIFLLYSIDSANTKNSHLSLYIVEKLCAFVDERIVEVAMLKFSFLLLRKLKCVIE